MMYFIRAVDDPDSNSMFQSNESGRTDLFPLLPGGQLRDFDPGSPDFYFLTAVKLFVNYNNTHFGPPLFT
jgi:hypothetical protein